MSKIAIKSFLLFAFSGLLIGGTGCSLDRIPNMIACYKIRLAIMRCLAVSSCLFATSGTMVMADPINTSQQELTQDEAKLAQVCQTKNVSSVVALATQLQNKWINKDLSSYYKITSAICGDLTNYDFGLINLGRVHQLDQEVAANALLNAKQMSLETLAYLTIQAAQPGLSANNKDWPYKRRVYAKQLLSVWQELKQQADQPIGLEPALPGIPIKYLNPAKYPNGIILIMGTRVDPSFITDAAVRSSYRSALEKYDLYFDTLQKKQDAANSLRWYQRVAPDNIAVMYGNGPDGSAELTTLLKTYHIDAEAQANIFRLLNLVVPSYPLT